MLDIVLVIGSLQHGALIANQTTGLPPSLIDNLVLTRAAVVERRIVNCATEGHETETRRSALNNHF